MVEKANSNAANAPYRQHLKKAASKICLKSTFFFQAVTHNCFYPALIRNAIEISFGFEGFQQIGINFYTDQFADGLFERPVDDSKIFKKFYNLLGR
jgi:hypothetical protein